MYEFHRDPGADGVGVVFTRARTAEGAPLSLGGAHGAGGRAPGISLVEADLGVPLVVVRQVHGADVAVLDDADPSGLAERHADAMVTRRDGVGLAVRVADCVPVLLADPNARVIGAAHAGRVGLAAGVLQSTVAAMHREGASDIVAWIGPHICGRCYEVPEALADEYGVLVPGTRSSTSWGTPSVDLTAGVHAVLGGLGVGFTDVARCTLEDPDLHSYRRDASAAGRQAGIIWLSGACRTKAAR
jgi:polyphenol oxidase